MVDSSIGRSDRSREHATSKELSFDEILDSMSPREVRAAIRAMAREEQRMHKHEQPASEPQQPSSLQDDSHPANKERKEIVTASRVAGAPLDASESAHTASRPIKMAYDEKSHSYLTEDGYIITLPGPRNERISGEILKDQLEQIARHEETGGSSDQKPAALKQKLSNEQMLVDLPETKINYRELAGKLPTRSLYGSGGIACAESAVTVGVSVWPFARVGVTKPTLNKSCQLAQTVDYACGVAELLSLDVKNARSRKELQMKADAVVTASSFCAETIDATRKEQQRIAKTEMDVPKTEMDVPKTGVSTAEFRYSQQSEESGVERRNRFSTQPSYYPTALPYDNYQQYHRMSRYPR